MPNWVANHLIIHGENAVEILHSLLTKRDDENEAGCGYDLDFNKIIPMPEDLNIISGSITETCAKLHINAMHENCDAYVKYAKLFTSAFGREYTLTESEQQNYMKKALEYSDFPDKKLLFSNKADVYAYGKRALDNYAKYGKDWYEWSRMYWGTKWNACRTQIPDEQTAEVYFDTAWSPVPALMQKLSEQHPDSIIEYEYAEEQAGCFAGSLSFQAGDIIQNERYEENSKECYETFFRLWGGEDDYKFNEKTGTYEYIENEAVM